MQLDNEKFCEQAIQDAIAWAEEWVGEAREFYRPQAEALRKIKVPTEKAAELASLIRLGASAGPWSSVVMALKKTGLLK